MISLLLTRVGGKYQPMNTIYIYVVLNVLILICDWIWEKPSQFAQEMKSILLLIIIATLKDYPDTVTQLL